MNIIAVKDRTADLIKQLTDVWERSVKATHLFLSEAEIDQIKEYVPQAMQEIAYLVIVVYENGVPVGFMGV